MFKTGFERDANQKEQGKGMDVFVSPSLSLSTGPKVNSEKRQIRARKQKEPPEIVLASETDSITKLAPCDDTSTYGITTPRTRKSSMESIKAQRKFLSKEAMITGSATKIGMESATRDSVLTRDSI